MYGKPVPKQDGAPLRLALPWKYGFKSVKSIVHFSFTEKRPVSFWETVQASEHGFWANVNPEVPHPRWSQATERVLGTNSGYLSKNRRPDRRLGRRQHQRAANALRRGPPLRRLPMALSICTGPVSGPVISV